VGAADRVGREGERVTDQVAFEDMRAAAVRWVREWPEDERLALFETMASDLVRSGNYHRYFQRFEDRGFHLTPVHFYSALPDTRELSPSLWEYASELPGIDMNEEAQLGLLSETFPAFRDEYNTIPHERTDVPHQFTFDNPFFGGTDALALYCMIRTFQPKVVLEVGSGHSTRLAAQAALKNGDTTVIAIEPYPEEVLVRGFPGFATLIPNKVQLVNPRLFEALNAGDILFIDSSHVVKAESDVNYLYLEILPRLKPGVFVHVHDIFLPLEYPKAWYDEHRFWTEQYLVQAFLCHNSAFEVVLANSYLELRHPQVLRATFPHANWWGGGSFWMRRRS
jgi:hypothetical protein